MRVLSIALKDLRILFKNRGRVIELFLMPLIFIVGFIGLSFAGQASDEDKSVTLVVVNLDGGGAEAAEFIRNLEESGGLKPVVIQSEAEARSQFENEDISRFLIIPSGFSADVNEGRTTAVRLIDQKANDPESQSVLLVVGGVARDMALQQQIFASIEHFGEMQAANPEAQEVFTTEKALAQAKSQFEQAKIQPLIAVQEELPQSMAEREDELTMISLAVPGWAVLFLFLTAQATARSIYDEKKIGSFRRLLAAPIGKPGLLSGKMLPNFMTVILQTIVIFGVSLIILPLIGAGEMSLGSDPLAFVLLVLDIALCSTALGIFIAALAKTEAQIGGISSAVLWVAGMLGGAVIRLYLVNDFLAAVSKVTPHYWAVIGFDDLLARGGGLADITDSLLALLGFTAVFLLIGLWRFDFD
jgi:ABC-2 type transport system permease protein